MAQWGIWDIIGLMIIVIPSIFLTAYLFPKRSIKNFYIDTEQGVVNQRYPKVAVVKMTNHTNQPIYIISEGFDFRSSIKPSPYGAKDATTGIYEIKFEGREKGVLSEIDTLIRPGQIISTWIPLNSNHSEEEINKALKEKKIGVLKLKCLRITDKRQTFVTLKLKI